MKKFFTIIVLITLGIILASTTLAAFSGFKLQQTYPAAGGSQLGHTEASKSIPNLVKYAFNLAVWLCILAAILTLIIGGIQYLTSSGDASRMGAARTRIYGSMLGLAILFGTYLVLKTVNPQFVVPKISYVPIKQGIVFFNKTGYGKFMASTDPGIINDLAQDNQAKFVNFSSPDLTAEFGPLVISECKSGDITIIKEMSKEFPTIAFNNNIAAKLNFADFEPYTLAFWGKKAQGAKLIFYNQPEYKQTADKIVALTYDYRGLLKANNEPIPDSIVKSNQYIKDAIVINPNYFGNNKFDSFNSQNVNEFWPNKSTIGFFTTGLAKYLKASNYFNIEGGDVNDIKDGETLKVQSCGDEKKTYFNLMTNADFKATINDDTTNQPNIQHPPLSVRITWSTPGVYLLAADGDERYFDSSERNFKSANVNFDQKAQDIKIINDTTRTYVDENGQSHTDTETSDFLAILHENDNFSGNLKIYFEQRLFNSAGESSQKAKNKRIPGYSVCGTAILKADLSKTITEILLPGFNKTISAVNTLLASNGQYTYWKNYDFGHLPMIQFNDSGGIKKQNDLELISRKEIINTDKSYINYEGGYESFEETRYGVLKNKPSSIEVFELADDPSVCEEVRLCTEKGGKGYCLSYVLDSALAKKEHNTIFYPMPVYLPVNILRAYGQQNCNEDSAPQSPLVDLPDGTQKKIQFAKQIKSIYITGKCAVVLFGGGIATPISSISPNGSDNANNLLFQLSMSGNKSEVFTASDSNLEDNEIGQCGSIPLLNRWVNQPCAQSIAVYPIK